MSEIDFDKYKNIEVKELEDLKLQQICIASNILKDKEIERLNNIITELEKWLEEMRFEDIAIAPDEALDKLKELKQGGSNENN